MNLSTMGVDHSSSHEQDGYGDVGADGGRALSTWPAPVNVNKYQGIVFINPLRIGYCLKCQAAHPRFT